MSEYLGNLWQIIIRYPPYLFFFLIVPPDIDDTDLDKNPRVNKGHTSVLFCPVTGNPPPEIIWLKDGEPLELDTRITMEADGHELRIQNASVLDTAKYTCKARNKAGQDAVNFDVEVQGKSCVKEKQTKKTQTC